MKVFVFGASGIIGQHMLLNKPTGVIPYFFRGSKADYSIGSSTDPHGPFLSFNTGSDSVITPLVAERPDVIVNLAGENRVDVVEQNPELSRYVNVLFPASLANLSTHKLVNARLIQVSTQGVFSGENPTYSPNDTPHPVTEYGKQKLEAEQQVLKYSNGTIARVTFVLGVRPFQRIGRVNPLEQMFTDLDQKQVNDRWFSPAFANDVARQLWRLVLEPSKETVVHIGEPVRLSRYDIAMKVAELMQMTKDGKYPNLQAVSHETFKGIAPRPRDTTWANGALYSNKFEDNLISAFMDWKKYGLK